MYAFAPRSTKRRAAARRPAESRSVSLALAGLVASTIGAWNVGTSAADLIVWLMDQEGYWATKEYEAQAALDEARAKLLAIEQARQQAEAEAAANPDDTGGWW